MSSLTLYEEDTGPDRTVMEEQLTLLTPMIVRAARSVAFQWPGVVEEDDVVQGIRLRLWESPGSLAAVSEMDDRSRYRAVVGIGHQLASAERSDYSHYKGSYRYSVHEARLLLKQGALDRGKSRVQEYDTPLSTGSAGPTDPIPDAVTDLLRAFEQLEKKNRPYADAIQRRFLFGEYPDTKHEENALRRGTEALVAEMNRVRRTDFSVRDDGPGTREVLRISQAQHRLSDEWGGDPW